MPAAQILLFPDPRPLVERLGSDFFRGVPKQPGVYLMRDAGETVLYVGKARNLRQRLRSYRVANPDRVPRRHLRLLRAVARIELEICADEPAALARESELLRQLKPRFNRAGTWPGTPRHLAWRRAGDELQLAICSVADPGWQSFGPLGGGSLYLRGVIVRLLWRVVHPGENLTAMPAGWLHNHFPTTVQLACGTEAEEIASRLQRLLAGETEGFCEWVAGRQAALASKFDTAMRAEELESLRKLLPKRAAVTSPPA